MGISSLLERFTRKSSPKNKIVDSIAQMLEPDSSMGGLDGVLERFRQRGMTGKVDSWVAASENRGLTPREVEDALGEDKVERIALKSGVSHEEAAAGVASNLPDLVDRLTPEGRIPGADELRERISDVRKMAA